ncbi:MAG: NAD-dependent epimerase/dehydratase family protein [Candidatus Omnitrophota bacterium]
MRTTKTRYLVTGGCGFIGSHVVDRLIKSGAVIVYDNLSSGKKEFINGHLGKKNFRFIKADLLNKNALIKAMSGVDVVFHMAANPEIRIGEVEPEVDFKQGIVATYNVLEAMRLCRVKKIAFASSSTVFGEPAIRPTPEDYAPLKPISVYGASKLACEGLVSAYSYMFGIQSWIFRFANIVGKRGTHGILVDFLQKLEKNRKTLEVLGNGRQRKSYLLVEDVAGGMLFALRRAGEQVNIFNLGTADDIRISEIAGIVLEKSGLAKAKVRYTGGSRGWKGDVPLMLLDISKIRKLGWRINYGSRFAVIKAVDALLQEKYARPE